MSPASPLCKGHECAFRSRLCFNVFGKLISEWLLNCLTECCNHILRGTALLQKFEKMAKALRKSAASSRRAGKRGELSESGIWELLSVQFSNCEEKKEPRRNYWNRIFLLKTTQNNRTAHCFHNNICIHKLTYTKSNCIYIYTHINSRVIILVVYTTALGLILLTC